MRPDLSNGVAVDDVALVARARAGDRQAFAALVQRHQAAVYRVCYRVLGHRQDAEDAAQEAFLRAYRKLATFRGESAFGTWLLRLAVNVALNERTRRRGLLRWGRPAESGDEGDRAGVGAAPGPEAELLRAEAAAQLQRALAALRPEHRTAVVLRDLEGLSYAEVAAVLGIPEGTAKGWVRRGRARLKELLT